MENQFSRTELLFGTRAMEKIAGARVAVFGIGGVGGYTVGGSGTERHWRDRSDRQ